MTLMFSDTKQQKQQHGLIITYFLILILCILSTGTLHGEETTKTPQEQSPIKQVANEFQQPTGQLLISSEPKGASIVLDGKKMAETTESLLKNISVGKHVIELYKDNLIASTTIDIHPNETLRLNLKLSDLITLQINSTPYNAEVFLDNNPVGQTPLNVKTTSGKHHIRIRHDDYLDEEREVDVKLSALNRLEMEMKKSVVLIMSVTPSNSTVTVNGKPVDDTFCSQVECDNASTIFETSERRVNLPLGAYKIKVKHPKAEKIIEKTVFLSEWKKEYKESLKLQLIKDYVKSQEFLIEERYWYIKWVSALSASLVVALYAYQENLNAIENKESYDKEIKLLSSALTQEEARPIYEKARKYNDNIKTHNQNTQTGTMIAVGLAGLAAWFWIDSPEPDSPEPDTSVSWHPTYRSDGQFQLTWNYHF